MPSDGNAFFCKLLIDLFSAQQFMICYKLLCSVAKANDISVAGGFPGSMSGISQYINRNMFVFTLC